MVAKHSEPQTNAGNINSNPKRKSKPPTNAIIFIVSELYLKSGFIARFRSWENVYDEVPVFLGCSSKYRITVLNTKSGSNDSKNLFIYGNA